LLGNVIGEGILVEGILVEGILVEGILVEGVTVETRIKTVALGFMIIVMVTIMVVGLVNELLAAACAGSRVMATCLASVLGELLTQDGNSLFAQRYDGIVGLVGTLNIMKTPQKCPDGFGIGRV
jgi:hypothetical protein